jgi:hypothetical protein
MLSALPPQQILDLPTDNWSIFTQAFTQLCFTKFGVAGQQILSDRVIPLVPFATAPTKNSLESDANGLQSQINTHTQDVALPLMRLLIPLLLSPTSPSLTLATENTEMTSKFTQQPLGDHPTMTLNVWSTFTNTSPPLLIHQ